MKFILKDGVFSPHIYVGKCVTTILQGLSTSTDPLEEQGLIAQLPVHVHQKEMLSAV